METYPFRPPVPTPKKNTRMYLRVKRSYPIEPPSSRQSRGWKGATSTIFCYKFNVDPMSARSLSTSEAEHHPPVPKSTDPGDGTRHLRKCFRRRRDGSTPPLHTTAPPTDLLYLSLLLLCPGPTHSFDPACATRSTWPCAHAHARASKATTFPPLTIPGRGRDTVTKKIKHELRSPRATAVRATHSCLRVGARSNENRPRDKTEDAKEKLRK